MDLLISTRIEEWRCAVFYEDRLSRLSHAPVDTRTSCSQTMSNVPMTPPCEDEVRCAIRCLQRNKVAGLDGLPPALFKDGRATLSAAITQLFIEIWHSEDAPVCWGESIVILIFKKCKRTVCSNPRDVSLIPVIAKLLTSIFLCRSTLSRVQTIREQKGFRPGRGCVDQIFTLRQHIEHRHIPSRNNIRPPRFQNRVRFSRPTGTIQLAPDPRCPCKVCEHIEIDVGLHILKGQGLWTT